MSRHRLGFSSARPWKLWLAVRMWAWLVALQVGLRFRPLPAVVEWVCRPPRRARVHRSARQLSRINDRVLRVGRYRPRCVHRALVHLRFLRAQGDAAVLVIGLPERPTSKDAHAWVELDGRAVGPPPGRAGHLELVRYPAIPRSRQQRG